MFSQQTWMCIFWWRSYIRRTGMWYSKELVKIYIGTTGYALIMENDIWLFTKGKNMIKSAGIVDVINH